MSNILTDLQSQPDHRGIGIDKVGIRHLEIPVKVRDREDIIQETIGIFDASVQLDSNVKGTHMSRFVEVLHDQTEPYSVANFHKVIERLRQRLGSKAAYLVLRFPFFLQKLAPKTGRQSLMNYQVAFNGSLRSTKWEMRIEVAVPVKTLCPCSKSISLYGAHSQRGIVKIDVKPKSRIWIEEIIEIAETSGSAPLYSILKRPDEKHITEQAYENPVFVEDFVRNVVSRLRADSRIGWYRVEAENYESIHNHNAFAHIEHKATNPSSLESD